MTISVDQFNQLPKESDHDKILRDIADLAQNLGYIVKELHVATQAGPDIVIRKPRNEKVRVIVECEMGHNKVDEEKLQARISDNEVLVVITDKRGRMIDHFFDEYQKGSIYFISPTLYQNVIPAILVRILG